MLYNIKAECLNSALSVYQTKQIQKQIITEEKRNYELANILFQEEEYSKAMRLIFPLTEKKINDKVLELKINFLAGKILQATAEGVQREVYHLEESNTIFSGNFKAIYFFRKSLKLINDLESSNLYLDEVNRSNMDLKLLASEIFLALSACYITKKDNDSSKFYLEKLISINSVNNKIIQLQAKAYTNIGRVYTAEGDYNKAKFFFKKSIEANKNLRNDISLALALNNLGSVYMYEENFLKAKEALEEALIYLKDKKTSSAIGRKEMIYDNLAWVLYKLKDYKAYDFVTRSHFIRDSLNEVGEQKKFKEIEALHNVDMVRQQEQIKIERQERKTWVIGVTGILVSLLLLYLVNLYKLRQRSLSLKLSQNELKQQKKLEQLKSQSQVKIINATIDGKETERKQIAEILHDNVSALLSSASMHLQASQKQFKNTGVPIELAKTQQIINEASMKIRDLSHNLMSSLLLKFGLEFAVKDLASKFSNSHIKINTAIHNVYRYSEDYEIKIFNIIQELINNILKHSHASNAYIIMEEENDTLNIIVKDDGIGFKDKSEEDKGIGINQIKARVHMMDGSFFIESSIGMGTKAIIQVPVVRKDSRVHSA